MLYLPNSTAIPAVDRELDKIRATTREPSPLALYLDVWNAAPAKPSAGMVVYADGTNWNPGSGEGLYVYYASAWNFLG